MAQRLIKVHYSGRHADRASSCASFEGAIRAATIHLLMGDYTRAEIYDHRFGENKRNRAILMVRDDRGIHTVWGNEIRAYVRNHQKQGA
jgi:hypothetical protein